MFISIFKYAGLRCSNTQRVKIAVVKLSAEHQNVFLRNKNQRDALSFQIYYCKYPLHVSNRLTIHHQETVYCVRILWRLLCIHVD